MSVFALTFRPRCASFSLHVCVFPQGYHPLFVNATAGSTVYGAFDPINEIADICEKYNMWLHVDVSTRHWIRYFSHFVIAGMLMGFILCPQGAWGGGLLMSRKHRHKLSGVER